MPPDGGFFAFLGMPCKCPPADMLTLYSYLHGKQTDKTERAKRYQEMYKA